MNNEQWIKGGDCKYCRKEKYCKTKCKEAKKFAAQLMRKYLAKILVEQSFNKGKETESQQGN